MSGPALRRQDSHRLIHQMAWSEAQDILNVLKSLWDQGNVDRVAQTAEVFLEHIETRILSHAVEEETGLYGEWRAMNDEWAPMIASLVADHEALRQTAQHINSALTYAEYVAGMSLMQVFLDKSRDHSAREEDFLGNQIQLQSKGS
ncbi:MAG: hypothetical protein M1596_01245 [Firmicutes bacterium]|nr:hypothetical protein [Bacillota bacterium]